MGAAARIVGIGWYNANALRCYPLVDEALETDTTGAWTLPRNLVVDFIFSVRSLMVGDPTLFHIYSVTIASSAIIIAIGYNNVSIASVSIPTQGFVPFSTYSFTGIKTATYDFSDCTGKITVGEITTTMSTGAGTYVFNPAGAGIIPTLMRPDVAGINAIYVVNGNNTSLPLTGDVYLVAGTNVRITPILSGNQIRIDAISGEGLSVNSLCSNQTTAGTPITTINGVSPNAAGNFTITGDSCLGITPITNGIQLKDNCSQPCCGSPELTSIQTNMATLNRDVQMMKALISNLGTSLGQVQTALAAVQN